MARARGRVQLAAGLQELPDVRLVVEELQELLVLHHEQGAHGGAVRQARALALRLGHVPGVRDLRRLPDHADLRAVAVFSHELPYSSVYKDRFQHGFEHEDQQNVAQTRTRN